MSIIELLVSTAIVATVSAAMLPAIALAARLQRESAVEMEAALMASRRLETLKADVAAGGGGGGSELLDRAGAAVSSASAVYECSWTIEPAPGPPGQLRLTVRLGARGAGDVLVIATVVPDG